MKSVFTPLGFALGASAAALVPRDQCCFGLTASGGVSGTVGQLSDGQNRIAQTAGLANGAGSYCLNNGQVTDGNGRGCILTPPTTQFQCDTGATPTGGFSVSNGELAHNGSTQFYACATGDNGGYNIYTTPVSGQDKCVTITLSTGGKCSAGSSSAPASSAAASSAAASSAPASSAPASSAPASSAPASSVAASASAPASPAASSASAGPVTHTIYSTYYATITSCGAEVTNCPAESSVVSSAVESVTSQAPAASSPAPASSAPAASSQPESSAPAAQSSAPAGSAPAASSAPASSAPASSAPASSAPASSAPASSAPASSAPVAQSSAPASGVPATSTANSTTTPAASGSACQTSLSGAYQTPHAIIPVNKNQPSTSYGTQYDAYIGSGNSTVFNFDIPSSYSGKQCSVIFLFPEQSQLETSSFTLSGSGGLTFDELSSAAGLDVTYSSLPSVKTQLSQISSVTPGNSYIVSTGACAAGTTESIEVSSTGSLSLQYFEDWNPSPIGLFITSC